MALAYRRRLASATIEAAGSRWLGLGLDVRGLGLDWLTEERRGDPRLAGRLRLTDGA